MSVGGVSNSGHNRVEQVHADNRRVEEKLSDKEQRSKITDERNEAPRSPDSGRGENMDVTV